MTLPSDPTILLGFVNAKLRDDYSSLDELCEDLDCEKSYILGKLASVGYYYDETKNKFI